MDIFIPKFDHRNKKLLPVHGKYTVQLFDDLTGKLVHEEIKENRISAVLYTMAYCNIFLRKALNKDNSTDYFSNFYGASSPFAYLLLTSGDVVEDPYDRLMWGSIVGYADAWSTYAGGDNLRGTINVSESTYPTSSSKHWVFDFPTNAANGTFKSLYMGGLQFNKPYSVDSRSMASLSGGNNCFHFVCTDSTKLYVFARGTTYKPKVFDKFTLNPLADITITMPGNSSAACYDGTYLYLLWNNSGTWTVRKFDSNYASQGDIPLPSAATTGLPNMVMYGMATYNDKLYFAARYDEGSSYKLIVIAIRKDGTFVNRVVYGPTSGTGALVMAINNYIHCGCLESSGNYAVYDENLSNCVAQLDTSKLNISNIGYYASSLASSQYYDKDTDAIFVGCNSGLSSTTTFYKTRVIPTASHSLLSQPVTKTPTNTMKIQYDISMDYFNPLDMPPH